MNNIDRKYIGICLLILAGFLIQGFSEKTTTLSNLMLTYEAESKIQSNQIQDLFMERELIRDKSYSRGFEDGKTQTGVFLAQGKSLLGYTEGYHAAIDQFSLSSELTQEENSPFSDLLLEAIEREISLEESYWELLDLMLEATNLNAKVGSPNK